MYYITKNGLVTNIKPNEEFLEVNEYPVVPYRQGYVGSVSGFYENEVTYTYVKNSENTEPQLTDTQQVMQAFSDAEIRDFEAQEERKMLAQQMTDIELAMLGGNPV